MGYVAAYEKRLEHVRVDFQQSMQNIAAPKSCFASTRAHWDVAEDLYNKYVMQLDYSESVRIPLIIHHVWLGSNLPEYAKKFRQSWQDYCDGWTFILWTDHPSLKYGDIILHSFQELSDYLQQEKHAKYIVMDMNHVVLHNQVALKSRARNYGEKSDLIRYEALYQVGGLYVDTDFECIASFEDLHHALEFYIGIAYDHRFFVLNGLIAAQAGDPILARAITALHNKRHSGDSMSYAGPHFLTGIFLEEVERNKHRAVAFPLTYFYSMPSDARGSVAPWLRKESYAVHHWKMSWM